MDLRRRVARSWIVLGSMVATILGGLSGCSTLDLDPVDYLPSKETWEKLSPSNLFYNLQPTQLQRLNENDVGMPTDAYYSVRDPLPNDGEGTAAAPSAVISPSDTVPPTPDARKHDSTIVSQ